MTSSHTDRAETMTSSHTELAEDLVRGCYVRVKNSSSIILSNPQIYLYRGKCSVPLALTINPNSVGNGTFVKTSGKASGSVVVFTYDLSTKNPIKLAVMFSVPYNRNVYVNWFAIGLFDINTMCDYDLYYSMYYKKDTCFVRDKAGGNSLQYKSGAQVVIQANMANTGTAVLRVEVSDKL